MVLVPGMNLPFYSSELERVCGVDPSVELQQIARKKVLPMLPVEFLRHSAEEPFPLPDGSIDTIVGTWIIVLFWILQRRASADEASPILTHAARDLQSSRPYALATSQHIWRVLSAHSSNLRSTVGRVSKVEFAGASLLAYSGERANLDDHIEWWTTKAPRLPSAKSSGAVGECCDGEAQGSLHPSPPRHDQA